MFRRNLVFYLPIVNNTPLLRIDEEHTSGAKSPLVEDAVWRDVEDANLGGHYNEIVLCNIVSRWTEAVPVEDRSDNSAVGKGYRGGAVPRLHEAAMILVKRLLGVTHPLVVLPRLGDHHHYSVREGVTRED